MGQSAHRALGRVWAHLAHGPLWPFPAALALALLTNNPFWSLRINWSASVPYRLLFVRHGASINRGDYIAFRWTGPAVAGHSAGEIFLKRVAGVAGDSVACEGRAFFVNGAPVGVAKAVARNGTALDLGQTGTLPVDSYYVYGGHPDSFDSRYRTVGWVRRSQIIGKAYALF
jgi:conjugal transfer pilin signal peptidase TrbI